MDIFEPKQSVNQGLNKSIDWSKNVSQIYYELQNRFGYNYNDIEYIVNSFPSILKCKVLDLLTNLKSITGKYNLKNSEIKYLILKKPSILLMPSQLLKYQIKLVSKILGISVKDSLKIMYVYPELLSMTKKQVIAQIKMISTQLNQYGLTVRRMFKIEPRLIFVPKEQIENVKKFLMHKFTLSENECYRILSRCPTLIVMSKQDYEARFDAYYKHYFIKRDFKEMFTNFPEVLLIEPSILIQRIKNIENVFNVNTKKACEFVRKNPDVLFYDSIQDKFNQLKDLHLNNEYIFNHPSLFSVVNFSLPLKFMFARILNKEDQFEKIYMQDITLFLSKFIYLQTNHCSAYSDLLLDIKEFCQKYGVTERMLTIQNKPTKLMVKKFFTYYQSLNGKKANWTPIKKQDYDFLVNYINGKGIIYGDVVEQKQTLSNIENLIEETKDYLKNLCFSQCEINFLYNKNPNLFIYNETNIKNMVIYLNKNGYSIDKINQLLISIPSLFTYNIKDFVLLVEQIMEEEECEFNQAIEILLK